MKNILVQFDGEKYRLFHSTNQMELLGTAYSLDEVKAILSFHSVKSGPKIGDSYWYVHFGEDFRTGQAAEIRSAEITQLQVDYYDKYHHLPPNVYCNHEQAVVAMGRISAWFKDLCGRWEFNGVD